METRKLCKDCEYCRPDRLSKIISFGLDDGYNYARCTRPDKTEYVSGRSKYRFCDDERRGGMGYCGIEAKYFEIKPLK